MEVHADTDGVPAGFNISNIYRRAADRADDKPLLAQIKVLVLGFG